MSRTIITAELTGLLREIAAMPEGDVDAQLEDLRRYPCGPDFDPQIRAACLARLAELSGNAPRFYPGEVEAEAQRLQEEAQP